MLVSFSILTLGMITPPPALTMQEMKSDETSKRNAIAPSTENNAYFSIETFKAEIDKREEFINFAILQAEQQSFQKFGAKISPVIEFEFNSQILPKIQEAIQQLAETYPEETLHNLDISEKPSGGISEKIFHIYDKTTRKDLIRFHERRDQPPGEGYWFNFHYHMYHDQFQDHHELGAIYWDKNTPPKWLS